MMLGWTRDWYYNLGINLKVEMILVIGTKIDPTLVLLLFFFLFTTHYRGRRKHLELVDGSYIQRGIDVAHSSLVMIVVVMYPF